MVRGRARLLEWRRLDTLRGCYGDLRVGTLEAIRFFSFQQYRVVAAEAAGTALPNDM
jgi:hypothetical protein